MIEVRIVIVVADNAGQPFSPAHHTAFEVFAAETFGGFTLLPNETAGGWIDGGKFYPDRGRMYVVAVAGLIAEGHKIVALVEFAKRHYGQLAVYIAYLGQSEIL